MFNLKVVFALVFLFIGNNLIAHESNIIVDVYGTSEKKAKAVSNEIQKIIKAKEKKPKEPLASSIKLSEDAADSIRHSGNFEFIDLSIIRYPERSELYVTVDVVEKEEKWRLVQFFSQPRKNIPDNEDRLIESWQEYEEKGFEIIFKNKNLNKRTPCPAYHCSFGFDSPELSTYKEKFTLVEKNKKHLSNILRNDHDEDKRTAAAYLLAHMQDGQEVINLLIPSIHDPSPSVRNAAMRVLGETLSKVTVKNFPIEEAVRALNFPFITDRNKALYMIQSLIDQPDQKYADYIIKHAGAQLIDELKMLQPNVHGLAYLILKKLSKKDYGDRDIKAWDDWIKGQNKGILL